MLRPFDIQSTSQVTVAFQPRDLASGGSAKRSSAVCGRGRVPPKPRHIATKRTRSKGSFPRRHGIGDARDEGQGTRDEASQEGSPSIRRTTETGLLKTENIDLYGHVPPA